MLQVFAKAICETDPVYFDETAAKAAGYRSLPVPATFLFSLELDRPDQFGWFSDVGLDLKKILHGEQSFVYHQVPVAGDTLTISRFHSGSNPDGTTQGFSGPPGSPNGATDAGVTFNGLVFTDFSTAFSGFTLTSVTALPSFDASRIGISGKDLSLNFMGLFFTTGQSEVVLQAQTASSVPEGGNTLLLLGASGVSLLAGRFKFCGKISHGTA